MGHVVAALMATGVTEGSDGRKDGSSSAPLNDNTMMSQTDLMLFLMNTEVIITV